MDLAFFEIRVRSEKLEVIRARLESPAGFDEFFQTHPRPPRRADGAFSPGGVDQFVAVAGVFVNLLDATGAGALEGDNVGLAREEGFVL